MITIEEFDNWTKVNIDDRNSLFRKTIKDYGWSVYGCYISDTYEMSFINSNGKMNTIYVLVEFLDPFRNPCTSFEEPFNLGIFVKSSNQTCTGRVVDNMNELNSYLFTLLNVFVADVIQEPYDSEKKDIIDGLLGEIVF